MIFFWGGCFFRPCRKIFFFCFILFFFGWGRFFRPCRKIFFVNVFQDIAFTTRTYVRDLKNGTDILKKQLRFYISFMSFVYLKKVFSVKLTLKGLVLYNGCIQSNKIFLFPPFSLNLLFTATPSVWQ